MEKLGKKMKHNHLLTNLLKFGIFSLVMLAPIFSVATRCLYVICNKNAKDSYSGNAEQKYIDTQIDLEDMTINNKYYFSAYNVENPNLSNVGVMDINVSNVVYNGVDYEQARIIRFYPINNTTSFYMQIKQDSANYLVSQNLNNVAVNLEFTYEGINNYLYSNVVNTYFYYQTINKNNALDNVFEYSLSQLEESSYYNWTTNLGIYTPIHNMTSGLGAHDIVALLIAYWSIYIAIYIVFDIVIVCFTKISHLINGE